MYEYILIYYDNNKDKHYERFLYKDKMESFIVENYKDIFYYNAYRAYRINNKLNFD